MGLSLVFGVGVPLRRPSRRIPIVSMYIVYIKTIGRSRWPTRTQ